MTTEKIPPFPKRGEIFTAVKSSCRQCRERAGLGLDTKAIDSFLTTLATQEEQWLKLSANHGTKVPRSTSDRVD